MQKKFISITQARKDFYTIIDEVQKPGTTYTLTVHGQPKGVLLSYEEFESIMETLDVMSDPECMAAIKQSEKDWNSRIEFETQFGKSVAITSETVDRSFTRDRGFNLVLMYDPKFKSAQFFTPSFDIDLEPIYKKLIEKEPNSGWFLHQSHHMVICGSSSAPEQNTSLTFEQLIDIAKSA